MVDIGGGSQKELVLRWWFRTITFNVSNRWQHEAFILLKDSSEVVAPKNEVIGGMLF